MENKKWWDSQSSPYQSYWLRNALPDLDEMTKAMVTLIQEDGNSSSQKTDVYYKKRSDLIKMVEEFHRLHCSLAERFNQLRTEPSQFVQSGSSSSLNSFKEIQNLYNTNKEAIGSSVDAKLETPDSHPESVVEDPDLEYKNSNFGPDSPYKATYESSPTKQSKPNSKLILKIEDSQPEEKYKMILDNSLELGHDVVGDFPMGSFERERMRSELRLHVSKLLDDNLLHQAELIRRNDEKREVIKDLSFQLDRLMKENRALHDSLKCSRVVVKQNQSHISKLKGLILRRFWGGNSTRY